MKAYLPSANSPVPADHGQAPRRDLRFAAAVALILLLAVALRFYRIDFTELWADEADTFRLLSGPNWLHAYLTDNSPPLYNLVLRAWSSLAGTSVSALRVPSAVFGVCFVGAAIAAGTEFFNRRVGLWCGLVAALSPIHIYYSQEARNYSLLKLLLLLTYLMLWKAQRNDRLRHWLVAAACGTLALFTHYFACLALLPTAAIVWLWPDRESRGRRLKRHLLLAAASAVPFALWLAWSFLWTPHPLVGTDWVAYAWQNTPPALAIPRSMEAFSFLTGPDLLQSRGDFDLTLKTGTLRLKSRLLLLFFAVWVAIPFGDRTVKIPALGRRKAMLAITLFTPLLALWLISYIKPLYAVSRYDLIGYPAFVLLVGLSLAKLQSQRSPLRLLGLALCLLWFVPAGLLLQRYYTDPATHFHRPTAEMLKRRIVDGDVVIFTGLRSLTELYYLKDVGFDCAAGRCVDRTRGTSFIYHQYPQVNEAVPCAYNPVEFGKTLQSAQQEWQTFLRMRKEESSTVWVVFDGTTAGKVSTITYQPDISLLEAIGKSGVGCNMAAPDLLVMDCNARR